MAQKQNNSSSGRHEQNQTSYQIDIEAFSGPFQLLLSLVTQHKVSVGSISISEIADQYIAYIENMQDIDMDVASDFLDVASKLLQRKAASLLPEDVITEDDEFEDMTPSEAREFLANRIIEYYKYKQVSANLNSRQKSESLMHPRNVGLDPEFLNLLPDYLESVTLQGLSVICADLMAKRNETILEAQHIMAKPIPVEERMEELTKRLLDRQEMNFGELTEESHEPRVIVVTFLAILEMYRRGMVDIKQDEQKSEIEVKMYESEKWTSNGLL